MKKSKNKLLGLKKGLQVLFPGVTKEVVEALMPAYSVTTVTTRARLLKKLLERGQVTPTKVIETVVRSTQHPRTRLHYLKSLVACLREMKGHPLLVAFARSLSVQGATIPIRQAIAMSQSQLERVVQAVEEDRKSVV